MELSEEEIIRNVKRIIEYKVISNYINNYDSRVIQGLLDLYYKQQKEIEKLKKDKKDNIQVIYGGRRFGTEGMVIKDYIRKDIIIDKIKKAKEINWHTSKLVIEYFEELLKENTNE